MSIGVRHQNFRSEDGDGGQIDYREKFEGLGMSFSGNILGIQQGVGIANRQINTHDSGLFFGGEMMGGKGTLSYTWHLQYNPPVTIDELKSINEDEED